MSASDNLSTKQFNTEQSMLSQGTTDAVDARTRGIQNMTSNVFKPSFSSDYTTVRAAPSPGSNDSNNDVDADDGPG